MFNVRGLFRVMVFRGVMVMVFNVRGLLLG